MMSKFDYENFNDGSTDVEFVVHAKKYNKEQAIELLLAENDWRFNSKYCNGDLLRVPTPKDVVRRNVRWYPTAPEWCGYDNDGKGCYTYCAKGEKGSFPVWVIE